MTKLYDMIGPVEAAILTFPYLLFLIFLLAFICLVVKIITDASRKKSPGRRYIALTALSAIICCGLAYAIKEYPPDIGHCNNHADTQPMVNLVGYDYNKCKSEYSDCFYMTVDKELYSSEYPAGTIIEHSPKEGSLIAVGKSEVRCTVSKGPQMIAVPNTYKLDWETASKMFESVGLNYSFTYEYSETVPEGCVISTNPERNEVIEKGSTVNIAVSKGKAEMSAETEESEPLENKEE